MFNRKFLKLGLAGFMLFGALFAGVIIIRANNFANEHKATWERIRAESEKSAQVMSSVTEVPIKKISYKASTLTLTPTVIIRNNVFICNINGKSYSVSQSDCDTLKWHAANAKEMTQEIQAMADQMQRENELANLQNQQKLNAIISETPPPLNTIAPIQITPLAQINISPTPCVVYLAPGGPPVSSCQ